MSVLSALASPDTKNNDYTFQKSSLIRNTMHILEFGNNSCMILYNIVYL